METQDFKNLVIKLFERRAEQAQMELDLVKHALEQDNENPTQFLAQL